MTIEKLINTTYFCHI